MKPDTSLLMTYREAAEGWAREAAELIHRLMGSSIDVSTKSDPNDLVTNADQGSEELIAGKIESAFGHPVLGEEGSVVKSMDGPVWIVDPIDGTMNFVHRRRDFGVSIGFSYDSQLLMGVVYDVERDEMFSAISGQGAWRNGEPLPHLTRDPELARAVLISDPRTFISEPWLRRALDEARGARSLGSCVIELTELACGRLDAAYFPVLHPWDIAAARVICEEVGIVLTRKDGGDISADGIGSVLAAPPHLHADLLARAAAGPHPETCAR